MTIGVLLDYQKHLNCRVKIFESQTSHSGKKAAWRQRAEGKSNDALSERLRAAESEAAELKKQLEAARASRAREVTPGAWQGPHRSFQCLG